MKKLLSILSVLFLAFLVVGCGDKTTTQAGKSDQEYVSEAEGYIILNVDAANIAGSFYLSRTVVNEVDVTWTSSNTERIEIVKETVRLAEDDKEYEYWKAQVTLVPAGGNATTVTLTCTLTKGTATSTIEEKVRVLVNSCATIETVKTEVSGTPVTTQGVVIFRTPLATEYNNFSAYLQDATGAIMAYRASGNYYEDFAEGNEIKISGTYSPYSGLLEIASITSVEVISKGNQVPAPVDVTSYATDADKLLADQCKWVELKGEFTAEVTKKKDTEYTIALMNGSTKVMDIFAKSDNMDVVANADAIMALHGLTITSVKGILGWYNAPQIILSDINNIQVAALTDETRVDADLATIESTLSAEFTAAVDMTLPTTGNNGSTLAYEVVSEDKSVLEGTQLVIALPEVETNVELKVTATYGEITKTKNVIVTVKKPVSEPALKETTIADLVANVPATGKDQIYVVTGVWSTKDGVDANNNTYGNGNLTDENGNSIVIYGLSSTKAACLTFNAEGYKYSNAKDFKSLGITDGAEIKVGMIYDAQYKNYSAYLIEIIPAGAEKEPAVVETTIADLVANVPTETKTQIYVVTGTWETKAGTEPSKNTYGNGNLKDADGKYIVVYGLSSSKTAAQVTYADGVYSYKNAKDFISTGIVDGSVVKLGVMYDTQYSNYYTYLIEIISTPEVDNGGEENGGNNNGGEENGGNETPVVTDKLVIADYASTNGWENSQRYESVVYDSSTNISVTGTPVGSWGLNTGKFYTNGNNWRIYQNETPSVTITSSKTIAKVIVEYEIGNTGILTVGSTQYESGVAIDVNANTFTFSVGNTGTATNGQIRITSIAVVYAAE